MKRRAFLKTPAVGFLLPGALTLGEDAQGVFAQPDRVHPDQRGVDQKMHPDFKTYVDGIEYFYMGNGEIQGILQFAPKESESSFFGLTITDTEIFCRKWSSFLYHPERGFTNTRLGVTVGERATGEDATAGMYQGVKGYSLTPDTFEKVLWKNPDGIPAVSVQWKAGPCAVEEEFSVPSHGPLLFRTVRVTNRSAQPVEVRLSISLYANFGLFDRISVDEKTRTARAQGLATMTLHCLHEKTSVAGRYDVRADLGAVAPGETTEALYVYSIKSGGDLVTRKTIPSLQSKTEAGWAATTSLSSGNGMIDRMFAASKSGLRSVVSKGGRLDAGQWMYNMEWVSDHAFAIEALLHAGMIRDARNLLERNLRDSIGSDGRTIESSRWFGYDYTELNQNGILLWSTWVYYCWTGDIGLIKRYWKNIRRCAEFPLQPVFYDERARMVHNKREFWERNDTFGVEDGFEAAYQFWVSHGLAKAAELAQVVGDSASVTRWAEVSSRMKDALLNDPVYRMIEDGHWIKRRKRTGEWQRHFIPPDRSKLTPGSPITTVERPSADPDTVSSYPIIFGLLDPRGEVAGKTLDSMETIWNQEWLSGGYPRYNVTGEDNPPAPWPVASLLVARANCEAGNDERVWRVLEWLDGLNVHKSGSWFERYGQSITPPMPPVGILSWVWYELLALLIWHVAGIRPGISTCVVKPRLLKGLDRFVTVTNMRGRKVRVTVERKVGPATARVNGQEYAVRDGAIEIPHALGGDLDVHVTLG